MALATEIGTDVRTMAKPRPSIVQAAILQAQAKSAESPFIAEMIAIGEVNRPPVLLDGKDANVAALLSEGNKAHIRAGSAPLTEETISGSLTACALQNAAANRANIKANMKTVDFDSSSFRGAVIAGKAESCMFTGCDFTDADLSGLAADSRTLFIGSKLPTDKLKQPQGGIRDLAGLEKAITGGAISQDMLRAIHRHLLRAEENLHNNISAQKHCGKGPHPLDNAQSLPEIRAAIDLVGTHLPKEKTL